MKNRQQTTTEYESPRIDLFSIAAEAGFAQSGWNDGTQQENSYPIYNYDFSDR